SRGGGQVPPPRLEVLDFDEPAAELLQHPLLTFDERARAIIGEAFGDVIESEKYTCYACAVMPDHVHLLIRKHKHTAEEMGANLIGASREKLVARERRTPEHPVWTAGDGWNVFLEHPNDVRRVIVYIERNPIKIGLPEQKWP